MTNKKIQEMKGALTQQFFPVYQLCELVMTSSMKPTLLTQTLDALLRFLTWVPLGYIFETQVVNLLVTKFLPTPSFRKLAMQCLIEVASLETEGRDAAFASLYTMVMQQLYGIIPSCQGDRNLLNNIAQVYPTSDASDQAFIQNTANFLSAFFHKHLKTIENSDCERALIDGHMYLIQISLVRDTELFKTCLEYWHSFAAGLYHEAPVQAVGNSILNLGNIQPAATPRRQVYTNVLSFLRGVMVTRMAKPEEILIADNGLGEIIRYHMKETDNLVTYKTMKETLVFLTHLDYDDTISIMLQKLEAQTMNDFSWTGLNTLCWAIGSISGAVSVEAEKRFLVTVVRDLLSLCEAKQGKDNKAVIASNIMYVVGQYPRFLKMHWRFLKTVINKLFEFMHELHPGVQDMATDTFLKIAKKCRRKFVTVAEEDARQSPNARPFVEDIIDMIGEHIMHLDDGQIQTFYQAVAETIASHSNPAMKEALTDRLMALPNQTWTMIVQQAMQNISVLQNPDMMRKIITILRTNERVCTALHHAFTRQLGNIYMDMLHVYKVYSEEISNMFASQGAGVAKFTTIKQMRSVKGETIKLIETYVEKANHIPAILNDILPPLLQLVLPDYRNGHPEARDHEVLSLLAGIVDKCKEQVVPLIPQMFDAVFECTLQMITSDFQVFPDHRVHFFRFIRAVVNNCFPALISLQPQHFKLVVDSIVWGLKHQMRNVSEMGLNTLYELFEHVEKANVANQFYQAYYLPLLTDILAAMTDTFHKSGFALQVRLLQHMFSVVVSGTLSAPLWDSARHTGINDNVTFMQQYMAHTLGEAFPNLTANQVQQFVIGVMQLCLKDAAQFKEHMRDFLVQIQEFGGGDANDQLFVLDNEATQAAVAQNETQSLLQIPGMIGPHDSRRGNTLQEDMAD
jgi:exportin-1